MFKVVTDQLKVSQGWVRCGRCAEVFDAARYLLPRATSVSPIPQPTLVSHENPGVLLAAKPETETAEATPDEVSDTAWPRAQSVTDRTKHLLEMPRQEGEGEGQDGTADFDPAGWKEALQKRQQDEEGFAHSATSSLTPGNTSAIKAPPVAVSAANALTGNPPLLDEPPRRPDLVRKATPDEADYEDSSAADSPTANDVSFVREAQRKAFWKKPWVRCLLGVVSVVLLLALALQGVLQQRDSLAALEPRLEPFLRTLCGQLGCEIRPPRQDDALVIDSSTFTQIAPDTYRLGFVLKNTSVMPVEMPYLEVSLTDSQDQALVRRVLLPSQFGASSRVLAARSEVAGVVNMKISADASSAAASSTPFGAASGASVSNPPLRVAGYRVLAFYP